MPTEQTAFKFKTWGGRREGAGWKRAQRRALVEYAILGNHFHAIVEASNRRALSGAMRALSIRISQRLNAMMGRRGRVFDDRHHVHVLTTPAEARRALAYVRGNFASHAARRGEPLSAGWVDPYSSAGATAPRVAQGSFWTDPVTRPAQTWLLCRATSELAGAAASGSR